MGPEVYLFNLPPKKTCTPTHWCLKGNNGKPACYALRNNFLLPNVKKGAQKRYEFSRHSSFIDKMVQAINRRNPEFFRLHASGDFYSEEYVEKITEIATQCPETMFRTTTRRRDLTKVIQKLNNLPNFIVRESLDRQRTDPKMNLPFAAISSLPIVQENESLHCINDCVKCGYGCWKSRDNMDFDEH